MTKEEFDYYLNLDIDSQKDTDELKVVAKIWKSLYEFIREEAQLTDMTKIIEQLKRDFPDGLNDK